MNLVGWLLLLYCIWDGVLSLGKLSWISSVLDHPMCLIQARELVLNHHHSFFLPCLAHSGDILFLWGRVPRIITLFYYCVLPEEPRITKLKKWQWIFPMSNQTLRRLFLQVIVIHRCQRKVTAMPTRASFSLSSWDILGSGEVHDEQHDMFLGVCLFVLFFLSQPISE